MNENEIRKKVIDTAYKYLGYNEKDGTDDIIIKKYNAIRPRGGYKMSMSDSWCAAFASVVGQESGFGKIIPVECSCEKLISKFKELKCWVEDGTITPETADYIFYNWDDKTQPNDGWADHVGIVVKVSKGIITVIEGNMNDKVGIREIKVGNGYIRGYGKPKYKTLVTKVEESFEIGNVVELTVPYHYSNSFSSGKKSICKVGQAKITAINKSGAHPYHIVGTSGGCTAYGWVNKGDITKKLITKDKLKVGDRVKVTKAVTYAGKKFKAWYDKYDVYQVNGDKVVIGVNKIITCSIHIDNVKKL